MDGARQPALSSEIVRQVLLGLHGPYADPRVAIDALDNVETLVAELDDDGVIELAGTLVDLVTDSDATVATGAALALDVVRRAATSTDRLADIVVRLVELVLEGGAELDRAPVGFNRATHETVRAELAVVAARSASHRSIPAVSTLVELAPSLGIARVDLVTELAAQLPALVVANARTWVGPGDSAVVARLAAHHARIAVATAVRPWSEPAIRAVETAGSWQHWHDAELNAVRRVMRDEAPELTAPSGVGDVATGGRWWIVAERPWDWTLWHCDDGRAVLELVEGTVGMWTSLHELSTDAAAAIVAATVAGEELTGRAIIASH